MPAGETRTALDAILWEALSLAHHMAAGIPQVRADIRGQAWQLADIAQGCCPERGKYGSEEGVKQK